MQRVDGFYLYTVGWQVHPLLALKWDSTTFHDAYMPLLSAQGALNGLLYQSVFQVRTCQASGQELLTAINGILSEIGDGTKNWTNQIPTQTVWYLHEQVNKFEAVLRAEMGISPLYIVQPKANMDVQGLIESGHLSFPPELPQKVPEAILDAQQAMKCIAFELPTAAGFHLHRANESVLRRYFDKVAGEGNRPSTRNMGDYLKAMNTLKVGDPKVKAALRDLKDLHRNPLMHPEEHIQSVDDAISLMGGVRAAISLMLKEIPTPSEPVANAISALIDASQ